MTLSSRIKQRIAEFQATVIDNPYIPHEPTEKQAKFLFQSDYLEGFYGGAARGGKLLSLDTPIPTPNGWVLNGELKDGDIVFDEKGNPCRVIKAFEPETPKVAYKLSFDDHSQIIAGAEHLWLTFDAKEMGQLTRRTPKFREHRRTKRPSRVSGNKSKIFTKMLQIRNSKNPPHMKPIPKGAIRKTQEIFDTLRTKSGRTNHAIPISDPLQLPEIKLPLDPYILGLWLGDGTSASGSFTTADIEIVQAFALFDAHKRSGNYDYGTFGLSPILRQLKPLKNKHIPLIYLRASAAQRLALLQGLMDTDGTVSDNGSSEFTNTNKKLADGVLDLICGLGWKARIISKRAMLYGKDCGIKYNIKWTPSKPVFRLNRKSIKQRIASKRTTKFRYIIDCKQVISMPMRCVKVDSPSQLYLAGKSMIPTHNTDALLVAALQYISIPSYAALLLRRTYTDLSLPDALMDRAERWFMNSSEVSWHEKTKTWTFPSGATLTFGFLESERDKYRYQGAALQYVGFDELSQFTESQYSYLFSRLTRLESVNIPLRMRAASNPGGIGHEWVKHRFITPHTEEMRKRNKFFIPAFLEDNPHVDQAAYEQSLNRLDPVTREQLRHGNWDIAIAGNMFKREWFEVLDIVPQGSRQVRFWDMAATEQKKGKDPDWTVGCLLAEKSGIFYVKDIVRFQKTPADTENIIKQTARIDGIRTRTYMEQEPGASGKIAIDHYARDILKGFSFIGISSTGSKVTRAQPLSAAAQNGNVKIINGIWIGDMLSEFVLFPTKGIHDDIVDAMSGAFNELNQVKPTPSSHVPPLISPAGPGVRI